MGEGKGLKRVKSAAYRLRSAMGDATVQLLAAGLPKRIMTSRRHHFVWEKAGYHVTPSHFYWPIPDSRDISEDLWELPSEMPGVDMQAEEQLERLAQIFERFGEELTSLQLDPDYGEFQYGLRNDGFGPVDAEIFYSMIRQHRPTTLIEIGAGNSSLLAQKALEVNRNEGHPGRHVAVEPYPAEFLRRLAEDGRVELIERQVQDVQLSIFEALGANDILFIDSSHVAKLGSDVLYEVLEIIPRLRTGVVVHIHDIFFPYVYPKHWFYQKKRFWNEQFLVQAFLAFNASFRVLWSSSYMNDRAPELLRQRLTSIERVGESTYPSSLWIEKTG
ncbi:MAG: class I SAM-dependent methyltransferase [Polyangiales bacterium]